VVASLLILGGIALAVLGRRPAIVTVAARPTDVALSASSVSTIHLPDTKTKTRRDRRIPISPELRDILARRQHGMTEGPNPKSFKFGPEHYVFGDEMGGRIVDVKTAWENAVLKAHGTKPGRTLNGGLSAERQAKLAEIDLHFHDLCHEAGSRKLETGWPLHAVSHVPRTCERDDDGAISKREGRLSAGADRAEAAGAREVDNELRIVRCVHAAQPVSTTTNLAAKSLAALTCRDDSGRGTESNRMSACRPRRGQS
jgi:hypothetical protein